MTTTPRRFAAYDVLLLKDGVMHASSDVMVHVDGPEALARVVAAVGPQVSLDVNWFALGNADGITLVDTGCGTSWGPEFGHGRAALAAAGVAPEQVSRVLLTHVHTDHALGLFADGAAYFPNAQVIVPEADLAYFTDPQARAAAPEARRKGFDIADTLLAVYGDRVVAVPAGMVEEGIEAIPLPGHTPGHTGYLLTGQEGPLLIWGDAVHLAALQPAEPEIAMIFDVDPEMAARTRRAILQRAAEQGWTVAGAHVPGFSRVVAEGGAFRMIEA